MADKTISELTRAEQIGSDDLFVLEQSSQAKALTGQKLIAWVAEVYSALGYIQSITKTSTSGLVDTYTITFSGSASPVTFTVTNGEKGDPGDNAYVHIKYSDNQPTRDADMKNTASDWMGIYNGTSSTAPTHYTDYTWFKTKGAKGDTGDGSSVTNSVAEYQASASGTTPPTGTWSQSIPSIQQGQYLWTRTSITFNDNTTVQFYAVSYKGMDGTGTGDMQKSTYDPADAVANAGGIVDYVSGEYGQLKNTKSFQITLPSAGWNNKQQDVTNNNFLTSGYAYTITPAPTSFKAYGQAQIYADDITLASHCTFHCENVPTEDITVNVMRVVVN